MKDNSNNIPELLSPFDQLREVDGEGKEWWNSRKLARVMGYGKYWNFERVLAKAQAWVSQKGYSLGVHFVEMEEMAELGSGATRKVISLNLSRVACMAVAMNADAKKGDGKSGKRLLFANHDTRGYGKEHGVNHHSLSWCQRKSSSASHLRYRYILALSAENGRVVRGNSSYYQLSS